MKDYKKILEGVVNIISTTEKSDIGFANICTYIGENCPELKESEGERIRKAIKYCIKQGFIGHGRIENVIVDDCLAWLEKQGRKETTWNKEDEENMNNVLYILNQLKDTSSYKEDDIAEKTINWFKSLKDRSCSNNEYDRDMLGAINYCIKNNRPLEKEHIAWLEKQGGQKPADKVEPKFHEGEWITIKE